MAEKDRELAQLPKGAVKARKSDIGLWQSVLLDTPPPTLDRNDCWAPPPVVPADNNFIKPQLPPKTSIINKTTIPATTTI